MQLPAIGLPPPPLLPSSRKPLPRTLHGRNHVVCGTHVDTYHLDQVAGGMCRFCVYKNISNFVELFFAAKKCHPTPGYYTLLRSFTQIAIYCYCCWEYFICCFFACTKIFQILLNYFLWPKNHTPPRIPPCCAVSHASADIIAVIGNNIRRCNPRYFLYRTTQQSIIWQATTS